MAINPEIHTFIHHLHVRRSLLDQPWMTKLQHLQTIQTYHCHNIMTCRSIQRFSGASHTPGLGALGTNLVTTQINVRDGRVCLQRLGQGLETETDQGWLLHPGFYPFKSWSLKSGENMTSNSDMWISLIQNLANNAESDSCLQHLHIRQLSLNRDEWWNYRTSKPSKLVTVKGCRKHMETEAISGGLYRQNLITDILRTSENKHMQIYLKKWKNNI